MSLSPICKKHGPNGLSVSGPIGSWRACRALAVSPVALANTSSLREHFKTTLFRPTLGLFGFSYFIHQGCDSAIGYY